MFLFRAVFIIGFVSVAFVAQVSAFILPLSRYMLDVIPDDAENADADAKLASVSALDASASLGSDVPAATETSPVVEEHQSESDAAEPTSVAETSIHDADTAAVTAAVSSTPTSLAKPQLDQTNAGGHIGVLGSTTVLVGSVVAGILLAA